MPIVPLALWRGLCGRCLLTCAEIAYAPKQSVGYTGGTAATHGYLRGSVVVDRDVYYGGGTCYDTLQRGRVVILEVAFYAETRTQRRGVSSPLGGWRLYERERGERDLYATGSRTFVEYYVYGIVLHGGIQILLHYRRDGGSRR